MSLEDHHSAKGVQSHSSSVQSTPEKDADSDYTLGGSEVLQEFLKSGQKRELKTCFPEERKTKSSSEGRMTEQQLKLCNRNVKNPENRKITSTFTTPASKRQSRKGDNPTRFTQATEQFPGFGCSTTWICKNSACRGVVSIDDAFCRRCSCCICHEFDDNKDPSLWLVCEAESAAGDSCGLSCHIECAFAQEKLGVVNLGQYMHLDGSYCCAACGKVTGILGCWKKQLAMAKDARRVDVLCYRILLSYRLLDGTSRFEELHEIVSKAKTKLEAEVGPMNGESIKMARGIVSRLAVAADVQKLCSNAIDKAEEWLANIPSTTTSTVDALPAACRFLFEEVASSSLVIVLIDIPTRFTDCINGYKLWYCKSREETFSKEPVAVFEREKRKISITELQPCTEYTFRIIAYTEAGDLGHSEAKCFTESVEIISKNPSVSGLKKENSAVEGSSSSQKAQIISDLAGPSSGFSVRDLGHILHLPWAQNQGRQEGFYSVGTEQCWGVSRSESPNDHRLPPVSHGLDLNFTVPDLNEDLTPPLESSGDEDNDAASHGIEKNDLTRSNGGGPSDDSHAWTRTPNGDVSRVDSLLETRRKRACSAIEETLDCDSTLMSGSPFEGYSGPGLLDESFEFCVKTIRLLECKGYLAQEFRLKFLTWFSLRSTEKDRRIVNTFIRTLYEDQKSLAAQLLDSFGDVVTSKRPKNGLTSIP